MCMGCLQKLTQNLVVVLTSAYKRILINNKIELPSQEVCISSVEKFDENKVVSNIENAIIKELK